VCALCVFEMCLLQCGFLRCVFVGVVGFVCVWHGALCFFVVCVFLWWIVCVYGCFSCCGVLFCV